MTDAEKRLHQLRYKLKFYQQDPETFAARIKELEAEIEELKWTKFDAECKEIMRGE